MEPRRERRGGGAISKVGVKSGMLCSFGDFFSRTRGATGLGFGPRAPRFESRFGELRLYQFILYIKF